MTDKTQLQLQNKPNPVAGQIHTIEAQFRLAEYLAKSDLVPIAYRNKPANIMLVMTMAADYGVGGGQSLTAFYPVNGVVTMASKTILAFVMRHPDFRDIKKELTKDKCVITLKRQINGNLIEMSGEFTIEDAKTAGLLSKKNWQCWPKDMLFARAAKRACDRLFPDVNIGLFSKEEAQDGAVYLEDEVRAEERSSTTKHYDTHAAQLLEELAPATPISSMPSQTPVEAYPVERAPVEAEMVIAPEDTTPTSEVQAMTVEREQEDNLPAAAVAQRCDEEKYKKRADFLEKYIAEKRMLTETERAHVESWLPEVYLYPFQGYKIIDLARQLGVGTAV